MNQAQLISVIANLFPTAILNSDYTIAIDSSGNATIKLWNNALGTQPTSALLTTTLATLQLQQAQQSQLATLGAAYQAAVATPVPYMSTSFPNDAVHQQLLARAAQAYNIANAVPTDFYVPDVNNKPVPMTLAELNGLVSAIAAQEYAAFVKYGTLQAQVAAATTVAGVQAIVW